MDQPSREGEFRDIPQLGEDFSQSLLWRFITNFLNYLGRTLSTAFRYVVEMFVILFVLVCVELWHKSLLTELTKQLFAIINPSLNI